MWGEGEEREKDPNSPIHSCLMGAIIELSSTQSGHTWSAGIYAWGMQALYKCRGVLGYREPPSGWDPGRCWVWRENGTHGFLPCSTHPFLWKHSELLSGFPSPSSTVTHSGNRPGACRTQSFGRSTDKKKKDKNKQTWGGFRGILRNWARSVGSKPIQGRHS